MEGPSEVDLLEGWKSRLEEGRECRYAQVQGQWVEYQRESHLWVPFPPQPYLQTHTGSRKRKSFNKEMVNIKFSWLFLYWQVCKLLKISPYYGFYIQNRFLEVVSKVIKTGIFDSKISSQVLYLMTNWFPIVFYCKYFPAHFKVQKLYSEHLCAHHLDFTIIFGLYINGILQQLFFFDLFI